MVVLGGLRFEIHDEGRLHRAEQDALLRLAGGVPTRSHAPFHLWITDSPPWLSDDPALFPDQAPAVVRGMADRVRISHRSFTAEIDPTSRSARLFRQGALSFPLEATLRLSLQAMLPFDGGIALHAAAVIVDGRAVVFFGPSGAGKSTLCERSPHPVLSDEVVAVRGPRPFSAQATGFWGTLSRGECIPGAFPLAALVELAKGPLRFEPLGPRQALRRLLGVALLPTAPVLWSSGLGVLGDLASERPAYRMAWSPDTPPWDALRRGVSLSA